MRVAGHRHVDPRNATIFWLQVISGRTRRAKRSTRLKTEDEMKVMQPLTSWSVALRTDRHGPGSSLRWHPNTAEEAELGAAQVARVKLDQRCRGHRLHPR